VLVQAQRTGTTASSGTGGIIAVPLVTKGQAENETGKTNMNYFLGIATNNNNCWLPTLKVQAMEPTTPFMA